MGVPEGVARIAVCAAGADGGEAERLAFLLSQLGTWEPILLARLDADALLQHRTTVRAWVLLAGGAPSTEALVAQLVAAGNGAPRLAIGGSPPRDVSAWLPAAPSVHLLESMLKELLPAQLRSTATPKAPIWRRKADMIVGHSRATQQLLHMLNQLAASSQPVLVTGESGTGKELVARALHYGGPRGQQPFIAINCAAIPDTLFEAELFGYQRGAFTGAFTAHAGAFEAAHQGTLFLDEIGEMPKPMQAKLLRVLETSEVTRLGSTAPKKVQIRVVAATNRPLESEVKAGRFREDLYYRLRVYPVQLEPLRRRPEDIPPIASHSLALIAARERQPLPRLTPSAVEKLLSYAWPGNVRELVNVLERAVLVTQHGQIDAEHVVLPEAEAPLIPPYREAKARFEEEYFRQVLQAARGNITLAARLAHKTRKEVYDALKRLGMDAGTYRGEGGGDGEEAPEGAAEGTAAGDETA